MTRQGGCYRTGRHKIVKLVVMKLSVELIIIIFHLMQEYRISRYS
ncbi:hypothetical protein [Enterocloster citroniae]|nr:hypothetical protein [Enterocloster citroniae]